MKTYTIAKATPIGKESSVVNTTIQITDNLPDYVSLEQSTEFFTLQAMQLSEALFNSLPQGTMDRLLAEMMKRKSSLYIGLSR